jgi:sugar phosphate permease
MHLKLRSAWFAGGVPRLPFFYGWIIVGVAMLAQLVSGVGHPYVATGFIEPIRNELGWSLTLISGMYTGGSLLAAPFLLIMGRLLDRHGSRKMLTIICVLMGLVTMGVSRVSQPIHLLFGFAAVRLLGDTSLNLVSFTLVSVWFKKLRGRATAIASGGLATAHSTLPMVTHFLITRFGWRGAWIGFGALIWIILLIPASLLVRRSPESVGLLPDGMMAKKSKSEKAQPDPAEPESNFTLGEALHTRTFWLLLICGISFPLTITGLLFHYVPLMQTKGISSQLAAATLLLWGPSMVVGSLIGGFLTERIHSRYMLVVVQLLLACAMLWTLVISTPWQAFAFVFVAGAAGGMLLTTYAVTWANYFGRRYLGAIRGVASMNTLFFSALGALPFGVVFDITGSYDLAILILIAFPAISALAALFAAPPQKGSTGIGQNPTNSPAVA